MVKPTRVPVRITTVAPSDHEGDGLVQVGIL